MTPTFIELCAGCGGLSLGLQKAGLQPLLLIDNNEDCVQTLLTNHGNEGIKIKKEDMTKLSLQNYIKKCDILVAGIPCQAFSQAGKRRGLQDARGSLFFEYIRLLKECDPSAFLIENVQGLLTHDEGKTFNELKVLLSCGGKYFITYKLLNATDYNVPQKRKRVFILGFKKQLFGEAPGFQFPIQSSRKLVLRDVLEDVPESEGYSYPERKKAVMELVPPGGCWIDLPDDIQKQYMGNALKSGGGKRGMARRLSMDEPSLTLTTSPCQKQTERCHPLETRPLNVREYARIQTFPDDYEFKGNIASKYRQIGNAVPVELAKAIGESIMLCFSQSLNNI
jgi:DNA (cytosine-5)-methyltransferase 1